LLENYLKQALSLALSMLITSPADWQTSQFGVKEFGDTWNLDSDNGCFRE